MMRVTNRGRIGGEAQAFRDEEWLLLHEGGKTVGELARDSGLSVRHVKRVLSRARKDRGSRIQEIEADLVAPIDADSAPRTPWWLELVPLFPIGPFTPNSPCPHHGPIREGSLLCCMVCSSSGVDGHPAMARDPATDPRPEPKAPPGRRPAAIKSPGDPGGAGAGPETRRQRRARTFDPGTSTVNGPGSSGAARIDKQDKTKCRNRDSA